MELRLPISIVSQIDVTRILRELNSLDDFFADTKTRASGSPMQLPKLTRMLNQVAQDNSANLLDEEVRVRLKTALSLVLKQAPLLHISFAAEPSTKALERILMWFRQNIHPQALLQVGLQPTIAAGCVLRTPNKVFDMSMREYLKQQQPYLVNLVDEAAKRG